MKHFRVARGLKRKFEEQCAKWLTTLELSPPSRHLISTMIQFGLIRSMWNCIKMMGPNSNMDSTVSLLVTPIEKEWIMKLLVMKMVMASSRSRLVGTVCVGPLYVLLLIIIITRIKDLIQFPVLYGIYPFCYILLWWKEKL